MDLKSEQAALKQALITILDEEMHILVSHSSESFASKVNIVWNQRMRSSAGRAFLRRNRVELNPKLLQLSEHPQECLAQVRQTLRHELAHLLAHHRHGAKIAAHGIEWQQACSDLGIPGEKATHKLDLPMRKQQKRWSYTCLHCSDVILRVRRMSGKAACYSCCKRYNKGKFHKKFTFIEKPCQKEAG